jgi:hypothetical protein
VISLEVEKTGIHESRKAQVGNMDHKIILVILGEVLKRL